MIRRFDCLLMVSAITVASGVVRANVPMEGTYALSNYPGGVTRPPLYGLRVNDLLDINIGKTDVFTFDFDAPGSRMFLDYNGSTLHIHGTAFGGLNNGRGYASGYSGFWNIDFTYGGVTTTSTGGDLVVPLGTGPNTGTITYIADPAINQNPISRLPNQSSVTLYDYAPSSAYTFRLGDEATDGGSRPPGGGMIGSGWVTTGWVATSDGRTSAAPFDWLFSVNPVPLPGGVLLAVAGLMSAGAAGLRRKRRSPM